jgi:serine/threonine-protein kinase
MVAPHGKPQPPDLAEGTRLLDRYVILDRVAGGGMASIYRANDERLRRIVCVKLLRTVLELGSTEGNAVYQATYSHFLQEALALSRLRHPNTLTIFDFGYLEESGRPFQISEFLDGGNLEEHVRAHGALRAQDALAILDPIGGAIVEAHTNRIIHRDIKPSNILFGRIGAALVPKLADFGIAHSRPARRSSFGETEEESVSLVSLFSPRWAAPEQLAGAASGPATDIYSFALLAHYMLTGTMMFPGREVRTTFPERILGDTLVGRRILETNTPEGARTALTRAIRAVPEQRTPSIEAFLRELRDGLLAQDAVSIRPPPDPSARGGVPTAASSSRSLPESGERPVQRRPPRVVDVEERMDLVVATPTTNEARFRLTLVPGGDGYRVNVKGLNCFVLRENRPTPAVVLDHDETLTLVSSSRESWGKITIMFGVVRGDSRVFVVDGGELLLPLSQARRAAAVHVERTGEVIVLCQRTTGA